MKKYYAEEYPTWEPNTTKTYTYDTWGRLTNFSDSMGETASYSYYSDGLRASKTIGSNTTRYYYNGDNVINETLNGSSYATNVMGADGYVSRKQNGTTGYLFKDAHGDVLSAYSSTTNKLADYAYDAWGEQRSVGNYEWGNANPIRYNGQYYDTESGMTYLRARYYDSSFRRFITEDPVKDGVNWYAYCANNPVVFADPSGLIPTVEEAAEMAKHIYNYTEQSPREERTVSGWRLIDVCYGGESSKMGIYIRDEDDWTNPTEYSVVFAGSQDIDDWQNNVEAYLSDKSADIWAAMNNGLEFVNNVNGKEVTFVGHSKGGGEAIAAATYTHRNAITFNAANFKFDSYGLIEEDRTGDIDNYYLKGEILSAAIGPSKIGITHWITPHSSNFSIFNINDIFTHNPLYYHSMQAIIPYLR